MDGGRARKGPDAGAGRFRAVCAAFVPEAAELDEAGWRELEAIVERALASRPAKLRRQLALFLRVVDLVAIARTRRTLSALSIRARGEVLDALSKSSLLIVRRGVWGLRTLAFMGYYARPEAARAIGYRATPAGWSAHPEHS